MPALAALLIPLIPSLVQTILNVVNAVRSDDGTPAEMKAKLDLISADLKGVMARVALVELPNPPAGG